VNVRLILLLSAIALVAVAFRTAEMAGALSAMPGGTPWARLLATEAAIWAAWTLWAVVVAAALGRFTTKPLSRGWSVVLLALLAAVPLLFVPLIASPVHRLAFDHAASLIAAWRHMAGHNAITNLLMGMTLAGVAYSYLALQRTERLRAQLADAQLEALRAQIEPHFLFNALNSIAVLSRRGHAGQVEQMVTRLAGLLRHSLDARTQHVTLDAELAVLRHYLEIEQVRFGDRLVVSIDVPEALGALLVPSFVLQPLAENAVRHGFTDPARPLTLLVRAERSGGALRLTVQDDGGGVSDDARAGIGLGNTRARLAALYGDRASLRVTRPSGGGTAVIIELPAA